MRKILIVDDHEVVRDGVKKVIVEHNSDVSLGEAGTIPEALNLVRDKDWHLVILDLALGNRSGLDLLKYIKQMRPHLPVLILSMHGEEQYARRAFKGGATGYITKDSPRAELMNAIERVLAGGRYVSPALAERLIFDHEKRADRSPHELLSDREFEVMRLIANGKTNAEIADTLSLSDKTISTYRTRILEKLGLRTNADITHYAIRHSIVDL